MRALGPWHLFTSLRMIFCHLGRDGIYCMQCKPELMSPILSSRFSSPLLADISFYQVVYKLDSDGKESTCDARDLHSIPRSGRSPGDGNGYWYTLVFLPGKFHGQRSLVGYSPWGHKEPDTTERLIHFFIFINLKISRSILISQRLEVEYIAYYGL